MPNPIRSISMPFSSDMVRIHLSQLIRSTITIRPKMAGTRSISNNLKALIIFVLLEAVTFDLKTYYLTKYVFLLVLGRVRNQSHKTQPRSPHVDCPIDSYQIRPRSLVSFIDILDLPHFAL